MTGAVLTFLRETLDSILLSLLCYRHSQREENAFLSVNQVKSTGRGGKSQSV